MILLSVHLDKFAARKWFFFTFVNFSSLVMDRIREFVDRETFHTISYVASISWIILLPLFVTPPVVSKLESTPDYRCNGKDKAPVHDKCFSQFKQYYEETGASVFVTFFGIINFSAITMVFFIYSQCVRRKVRINSQGDGTLLFCAYFVQLASRFVLHIISVELGILLYLKNDLRVAIGFTYAHPTSLGKYKCTNVSFIERQRDSI